MADALFKVEGLTVSFGGVRAVDGVDFDLDRGSILGIIGPNGAGKTTVFDAICGFVQSRGRVSLDGREISGMTPERRSRARLGRSFQDARLFPSLTVSEALAVGLERHIRTEGVASTALRLPWVRRSERRVRNKVDELIDLMGLGAFRDKFVGELSTGSRRIVDLALTMAHEPLVLLLDEPSSGIAQRETEALGPLLLRIRQETGASMLVIEHDMPLITSVSDEILALETGRVLLRGKPDEVLHDPALVAAYLGNDPAAIRRSGAHATAAAGADAAPVAGAAVSGAGAARKRAAAKRAGAKKPAASKKPAAAAKPVAAAKKPAAAAKKPVAAAKKPVAAAKKPAAAAKPAATRRSAATKTATTAETVVAADKVVVEKVASAARKVAAKKTAAKRAASTRAAAAGAESAAAEVIDLTDADAGADAGATNGTGRPRRRAGSSSGRAKSES